MKTIEMSTKYNYLRKFIKKKRYQTYDNLTVCKTKRSLARILFNLWQGLT
jgi:hypothetical protein